MFFPGGDNFDSFDALRKCKAFEGERHFIYLLSRIRKSLAQRLHVGYLGGNYGHGGFQKSECSLSLCVFIFVNNLLWSRSVRW